MNAFAMLDALDAPLKEVLDPGIYVEPKDKLPGSEDSRQTTVVAALRKQKQFRVYAVPNGVWMPSVKQRAKVRREGLNPGEPDLGVSWADTPTARIEMKDGKGDPSPDQICALNWYHQRGHPVAICRTLEGVLGWLQRIGAPVTARVIA